MRYPQLTKRFILLTCEAKAASRNLGILRSISRFQARNCGSVQAQKSCGHRSGHEHLSSRIDERQVVGSAGFRCRIGRNAEVGRPNGSKDVALPSQDRRGVARSCTCDRHFVVHADPRVPTITVNLSRQRTRSC